MANGQIGSETISTSLRPFSIVSRATDGSRLNRRGPAAPGFTISLPPTRDTFWMCVWPYTSTSASYAFARFAGVTFPTSCPWLTCTRSPPSSRSSAGTSDPSHGASVLPYPASTGAISASSSMISAPPTSPACRINSTPASAACPSGRIRPCVSLMSPISTGLAPPRRQRVLDAEMIEHARDDEIDQLGDAGGTVIEPGRRRQHDRPRPSEAQHVLEVNRAERRFARHEHQRPALLERYVRGALHQRPRRSRRDRRERAHRTGADHHAGRLRGPRRGSRAAIGVVVNGHMRVPLGCSHQHAQAVHVADVRFRLQQPKAVRRDDQRDVPTQGHQLLQQADAVRRPGRSGQRNHDRRKRGALRHRHTRAASMNAKNAPESAVFTVKTARAAFETSSAWTSVCSNASSTAATTTPAKYTPPSPAATPTSASSTTVIACRPCAIRSARRPPTFAGNECSPFARSNSMSCSAYRMSKPPVQHVTAAASATSIHHGSLQTPVTAR